MVTLRLVFWRGVLDGYILSLNFFYMICTDVMCFAYWLFVTHPCYSSIKCARVNFTVPFSLLLMQRRHLAVHVNVIHSLFLFVSDATLTPCCSWNMFMLFNLLRALCSCLQVLTVLYDDSCMGDFFMVNGLSVIFICQSWKLKLSLAEKTK